MEKQDKDLILQFFHNNLSELINFHGVKSYQRKRDIRKTYRAPIACFWTHFLGKFSELTNFSVEGFVYVPPLRTRNTKEQIETLEIDKDYYQEVLDYLKTNVTKTF